MVILHIACITNDFCKGVCVAVPQHINAQSKIANVGFINVNNIQIQNIENQFYLNKEAPITSLPHPFNKPDIVIFHEIYRLPFITIYKKLKENKIPYIIVPHGCMTEEAQKNKKIKKLFANFFLFNKFIYSAKCIQCLSENEKNNIKFKINKFVSGNGTNQPLITKENFNITKVLFVFIGRVDIKIKGLDILLKAISLIQNFLRDNNALFSIIGSTIGDDTKKLKKIIKNLNISDLVTVLDAVIGETKEKALLKSDIFILTSRTEGMPMGVIEALNYGIPCLVTKGTSVKEIVESNDVGWGCETNSESLAVAIKNSILEKHKWKEKSDKAKKLIQREYSWNVIASKTIKLYLDSIKN